VTVAATQPQSAEPIVRLRGVGRRFGGVQAVRDVDLDVYPGERRALLGPNGAGKTTLFNVISGEFPPTAGTVELFGRDVTAMPARTRAKLGLTRTFQTSRLFLGLTVEDNLYLAALGARGGHLRPVRLPSRDGPIRERAEELAERVGLADQLGAVVGSLSHGEQRQLEVGMARAGDPKVMMLDEPAAGLSRGERVLLTDLLLTLDPEITLILIEHDMDVALTVAERVTMMHDGHVIVEGTPAEIRANQLVHDLYLGSHHYGNE
jgi:branched-chain amino acid transport system ATP-binding protein